MAVYLPRIVCEVLVQVDQLSVERMSVNTRRSSRTMLEIPLQILADFGVSLIEGAHSTAHNLFGDVHIPSLVW